MAEKKKSAKLIKAELLDKIIDPHNPVYWDKPLWVVYGYDCFPSVVCLMINNASGIPSVWGYSIYKKAAGFRTLGQRLTSWIENNVPVFFFDKQEDAIAYLNFILTPKKGVLL